MADLRIGSLCSGYGGLDMAVQAVLGGELAWVSDIDKGANKILAHHHPDIPNLGDFTTLDWATVAPIDVLTAGFPCQPVSHAGKRLGDQDERWLWDDVARAVGALRPGLVVLENVRGLLTAGGGRLFGRVLGALADLGYDAQWHGLRAADVGAPHGRWRVFIVAYPTGDRGPQGQRQRDGLAAPGGWTSTVPKQPDHGVVLLPTPVADHSRGLPSDTTDYASLPNAVCSLLPTPTTTQRGADANLETRDGARANLHNEVARLLPTPDGGNFNDGQSVDAYLTRKERELEKGYNGNGGGTPLGMVVRLPEWGQYADAIDRWETLTRPAPPPTELGPKGNPRLSAAFSEWMMGLPAGWVTDVPGITRNEALKAIGNGVCPQQCSAALRWMLASEVAA